MHRAYQPLKPTTNKYLQQRWDHTRYTEHVRKVKTAQAMVDTKGIQKPAHIQLNLKKLQSEKERLAVIDRDNHLLSSKLADIMRSKGRVDHRNDYPERSLKSQKRRDELLEVSRQNQAILQRITCRESEYRRQVWEQDWEREERRRDDIARYPRQAANQPGTANQLTTKKKVKFESNKREIMSEGSGQVSEASSSRESEQSDRSSEACTEEHFCK